MEKIRSIAKKYPYLLAIAAIVLVCIAGYAIWHSHQAQPVTTESQVQAETPAGVTLAADNAHVGLSADQAQQTADKIKYIYSHDVQPVYTITTTGDKAQKCSHNAQNDAGADFSIITDKSDPNKKIDVSAIPATSTVDLNQYNVQAYKKVLHTIEVGTNDFHGVDEVGYTVSKKISKDGKYIGVGASYNFDDKKAIVKVSYTW